MRWLDNLFLVSLLLTSLLVVADGRLSAAGEALEPTAEEKKLMVAWGDLGEQKATPVESMKLPILHYPDGRVRALLSAERALIPVDDSGYVRAKGVVVEMYAEDGRFEGAFIADNLFFDRSTSESYCEGAVRMEWRDLRITGSNMVWNLETRNAKILSEPRVEVNRFMVGLKDAFKK